MSRSFCSDAQSASDVIGWKISASSANEFIVPAMSLSAFYVTKMAKDNNYCYSVRK